MKKYLITLSTSLFVCVASFVFIKFYFAQDVKLKSESYAKLPAWKSANLNPSFKAFKTSCKVFLNSDPEKKISTKLIDLKVKDFFPACIEANKIINPTNQKIKSFFETWFAPYIIYNNKPVSGLFTGYFMPTLNGSLEKTDKYNVPLYNIPDNMVTVDWKAFKIKHDNPKIKGRVKHNKLIPYYSRQEINNGAIKEHAKVIAWVDSKIDRQFLEIEGSGVIKLKNNDLLYIGYAGENGATYKSLPSIFIENNILDKNTATPHKIKEYFTTHPNQLDILLNQNQSFVFFKKLPNHEAIGALGIALTPGYSLAVDKKWIPYGIPLWVNTTLPDIKSIQFKKNHKTKPFSRLMIAQDTGGAIKGPVRGDIFLGEGIDATLIANHTKAVGTYWLLLPKTVKTSD